MAGMPPMSMSAGGGGPSGASANNGIMTPISNPFNFDHSGWVINTNSAGASLTASGNKDANQTTQSQPGGAAGLLGGLDPVMLAGAVALYLVLRK